MKLINYTGIDQLKAMSHNELKYFVRELRQLILLLSISNNGHLGSNLGVIKLTIALILNTNLPDQDIVLFDTGHQSYVYKFLTDRYKQINDIKKWNGLSGFQDISESNYDKISGGHSGTAIGTALGHGKTKQYRNIFVLLGDSAFFNGLSLSGLHEMALAKEKYIIIINDNGYGIAKNQHEINEQLVAGFNIDYLMNINGNSISALNAAFAQALKHSKSIILHVKTIKGDKLSQTALEIGLNNVNDTKKTYHKWSCDDVKSWNYCLATKLMSLWKRQVQKFYFISPGMQTSINMEDFFAQHPEHSIDVGIKEELAICMIAGLAINQQKVFYHIYSSFLQRCYDQIIHDIDRNHLPLNLLIDRIGLSVGDGDGNHGIYDIGMLKSVNQNVIITEPTSPDELDLLLEAAYNNQEQIFAIRLSKNQKPYPAALPENRDLALWQYNYYDKQPAEKCVIAFGESYQDVADFLLIYPNLAYDLIKVVYINPIDPQNFEHLLAKNYKEIIFYEQVYGDCAVGIEFKKYLLHQEIKNPPKISSYYFQKSNLGLGDKQKMLDQADMGLKTILLKD